MMYLGRVSLSRYRRHGSERPGRLGRSRAKEGNATSAQREAVGVLSSASREGAPGQNEIRRDDESMVCRVLAESPLQEFFERRL